jgi:hypothetical protein
MTNTASTECANGEDDLAPVKLVECGLEELLAALLARQPLATPSEGQRFILENDDARRILFYYARNRQLWPRAKAVQASEIEEVLSALGNELPAKAKKGLAAVARRRLWAVKSYQIDGRCCAPAPRTFLHRASSRQDNDLIVIESPGAAASFKRNFEARYASGG